MNVGIGITENRLIYIIKMGVELYKYTYNSKFVSSLDVNVQNTFIELRTTYLINIRSKIKMYVLN